MSSSDTLFVSFYTPSFEEPARELMADMEKFGLNYDIVRIEAKDGPKYPKEWRRNVMRKGEFTLVEMHKFKDIPRIVWLDADARVVKMPTLLLETDAEMAWYTNKRGGLMGGTVLFANTPRIRYLVRRWRDRIKEQGYNHKTPSQAALAHIVRDQKRLALPKTYCCLAHHGETPADYPGVVIWHRRWGR